MADLTGSRRVSRREFFKALAGRGAAEELAGGSSPAQQITFDTPILKPIRRLGQPSSALPAFDRRTWRLTIDGLVANPFSLTCDDLRALPSTGEVRTLVSRSAGPGEAPIGNAVWRGVRLVDLLEPAGLSASAAAIDFAAADGHRSCISLTYALNHEVLLAYEMNGAPLALADGMPLRALVPGLYSEYSPGWLNRITVTDHDGTANSTPGDQAIPTISRIITPLSYSEYPVRQAIAVQGIAFAGSHQIAAIEISIDGGGWMPVAMHPPDSTHAWTQWYTLWTPEIPGDYLISVRAADETGFIQRIDGTESAHAIALRVV